MATTNDLYPVISDDELRGDQFFGATVRLGWFSDRSHSFQKGDRLICQKTNRPLAVYRAVLRDGVFRSVNPTYDFDRIGLIRLSELTAIVPRPKMVVYEGLDKYINTALEG